MLSFYRNISYCANLYVKNTETLTKDSLPARRQNQACNHHRHRLQARRWAGRARQGMGSLLDHAVLHRPSAHALPTFPPRRWRCASLTENTTSLEDERCERSSCTRPGSCMRCRCRDCPRCQCVDRGRSIAMSRRVTFAPNVCAATRSANSSSQLLLGHQQAALPCQRACERAADCTVWMWHRVSGECVGYRGLQLVENIGWEPAGVAIGVAQCAPPRYFQGVHDDPLARARVANVHIHDGLAQLHHRAATSSTTTKTTRATTSASSTSTLSTSGDATPRVLVLHAITSWSVAPGVAARIARVHAQALKAGSTHRVALVMIGARHGRAFSLLADALGSVGANATEVVDELDETSLELAVPGLQARLEKASSRWADRRRPRCAPLCDSAIAHHTDSSGD